MMKILSNINPYFCLYFGVFIIGWSPILIVWSESSGVVTSFYRIIVAAVILFVPFIRKYRKKIIHDKFLILLSVFAGIAYALDNALWATGVNLSGPANPTFLVNTAPIWVGIGAMVFFKEKLGRQFWVGLLLAMIGAALILEVDLKQSFISAIGSLYGLLGGVFYAVFFLLGQRVRYHMDTISFFWIVLFSAVCTLGVITLVFNYPLVGYSFTTYLIFVVLGVVMQVIGWLSITYALGVLPASAVAPILLGQPVITSILAHVFLRDSMEIFQVVGACAVLIGVLITQESRNRLIS